MIFKQKALKEHKIFSIFLIACISIIFLSIILFLLIRGDDAREVIAFSLGLFLPAFLILCLCSISILEWYYIYDDRIEARGINGIINVVYFEDVIYVEEIKLHDRSNNYRQFYQFNDGRKNNNNPMYIYNLPLNKRKYNLRIYKTKELEEFLKNKNSLKVLKDRSNN